jgi:hypothetical protein
VVRRLLETEGQPEQHSLVVRAGHQLQPDGRSLPGEAGAGALAAVAVWWRGPGVAYPESRWLGLSRLRRWPAGSVRCHSGARMVIATGCLPDRGSPCQAGVQPLPTAGGAGGWKYRGRLEILSCKRSANGSRRPGRKPPGHVAAAGLVTPHGSATMRSRSGMLTFGSWR